MDNGIDQMRMGFMVEAMREEWCEVLQENINGAKKPELKEAHKALPVFRSYTNRNSVYSWQ